MNLIQAWIVPPDASAGATAYIVTAIIALLVTGVSKGGFGGGVGILSVPLMLQVASYKFVLGVWLPILIVCDCATIRQYPREWNPRAFWLIAPGALLGILLASCFLGKVNMDVHTPAGKRFQAYLCLAVAFISIFFVLLQCLPKSGSSRAPWRPTWLGSLPLGLAAGVTTTVSHAAGPILNMYFLPQNMDQRTFVGTCGRYYFTFNSIKMFLFAVNGLVSLHIFKYGLWLMLLSPVTVWLGARMNRRLNPVWFVRLIYIFMVLAAAKLAYDGWRALQ